MDFTFADVSSTFLNMVQPGSYKDPMMNTKGSGSQNPVFADRLRKTLENTGHPENSTPSQATPLPTEEDSEKAIQFLSEKLSREEGVSFVSALKTIFLVLSKGDLKNVSIDAEGLDALKKMLLKAGFREKEVTDLIAELTEELGNKDLALSDVMDRLFDLPLAKETDSEIESENYLQMSAIPFLESILTSLGIPREKTAEIFIEADRGEKGISLDVVIEKLQALQKTSFFSQDPYVTQKGDDNFRLILKQLGLEQGESKTSPLTLDELVASLENLRTQLSSQQTAANPSEKNSGSTANESSQDLFSALFKGLELKNRTENPQVFEFSYAQIKDQFKNELLLPGEGKINKNELFSLNREIKKDTTLKDGFKEIEAFLGGKKSEMTDPLKESKGFLKQMKSENSKLSDQGPSSEVKTGEIQSDLNLLKTKSSFKNLPTYVTHQVSKSLVRAINQGESILRIQLNPPDLGRLVMTIDKTGSSMKVSIVTEHLAAKEIISSNISDIKTALSNSGITLERFDVDMNSNFKQSMADARNQAGNSGQRHRNREKGLIDPITGEGINGLMGLVDALNQDGSIHFVA